MDKSAYLLGGALWINLMNTLRMKEKRRTDLLAEPVYAREWLEANDLPLPGSGDAALQPFYAGLRSLRELCQAVYGDVESRGRVSEETFRELQKQAADIGLRAELHRAEDQLTLRYAGGTALNEARHRVIRSIVDTLAGVPADRIRKCEHDECILHFVDTSKSGRRRWCSMERCGNRHKAAEFYARKTGR